MKNRDLFNFQSGLQAVGHLTGVKFTYAIAKTRRIVDREIKTLREAVEPTEGFKKYEEERLALCREHAQKDDNDEPVVKGNKFILKSQKKFDNAWEKLKEKHKEALDSRDKQVKEWESLLDEEADIDLHLVNLDDMPDEITSDQVVGIFEMISENGVG